MPEEKPKRMGGVKTWAAIGAAGLTGLGMIAHGFAQDPVNAATMVEGVLVLIGAVGLLGIGHKVEKAADIVKKVLERFVEKPK